MPVVMLMLGSVSMFDFVVGVACKVVRIMTVESTAPETKYDFGTGGERMNWVFSKVFYQTQEKKRLQIQGDYGAGSWILWITAFEQIQSGPSLLRNRLVLDEGVAMLD